jgi:thiamine-monophosphate kinase
LNRAAGALTPDRAIGELGERALLDHLRARVPLGPGVVIGIGDDAAALETTPVTLVTTDCLIEGVHFRRDWSPPALLGRKALTVNLSDIAAMAGTPRFATVSLALPGDVTLGFVDGLYDGLLGRGAEAGVHVVGGNVAATSGPIVIDVTLLGDAGPRVLTRAGARPGDLVVVTGTLGSAAAGLRLLASGARLDAEGEVVAAGTWTGAADALHRCLRAQLDPAPPLAFARALADSDSVRAAMDLSDGLSGDLTALCEASGVSAWLDPSTLPMEACAAALEAEGGEDAFSLALHGGEDYQLLMAVPKDAMDALRDVAVVWEVPLTAIGEFAPGPACVSLRFGETLRRLRPASHDHFRPTPRARET